MWNSLDFSEISTSRKFAIWDEFVAKLRIALSTEVEYGAIMNKFCSKFNINLQKADVFEEVSAMSNAEQCEIFDYIRENLQILIVDIRLEKERKKDEQECHIFG